MDLYFYRQPPKAADLKVSPSKLTLQQTLAEMRLLSARDIGQRYRLRWLRVRYCRAGSIPANWPVRRIDRDLISRSIGIDPLYDRREWSSGRVMEDF